MAMNENVPHYLDATEEHVSITVFGEHEHTAELHSLTINKYIEGEQEITGAEAIKLWNAGNPDTFTFGANLEGSEYAAQQSYSDFFFFITGFHGFHVFSGVIINIIIFLMAYRGVFERGATTKWLKKRGCIGTLSTSYGSLYSPSSTSSDMERDDLIVNDSYAMAAHHSEEAGVAIRKKIWLVTALLTAITAVEVGMGIIFKRSETFTWTTIKWTFIVLTLVKAAYIVLVFMHLGDERPNLKKVVIAPYVLFICYLLFIAITEGFGHLDLFSNFH